MRIFLFSALSYFCLCLNVSAKQWESPETYIGENGIMIAQSNDQLYFIKMLESYNTEERENNYKQIINHIRANPTITTAEIETFITETYNDDPMLYMTVAGFFANMNQNDDEDETALYDLTEAERKNYEDLKHYLMPRPEDVDEQRAESFFFRALDKAPDDFYKAYIESILALFYGNPEHEFYSPEKWLKYITRAAEYGLGHARFQLGAAYLHGDKVEKDIPKAYEWIKKAADENDYFYAIVLLGGMLFERDGKDDPYPGLPYDNAQLLHYAQKAIDLYDMYSVYGMMAYVNEVGGKNLKPDHNKAFEYAQKCTELDGAVTCYKMLGEYYRDGIGTEVDMAKAREMFQKAVDKGDENAEKLMQSLPAE